MDEPHNGFEGRFEADPRVLFYLHEHSRYPHFTATDQAPLLRDDRIQIGVTGGP